MDTRDRLLDAAERGMRSRGYHAVSFRELADELGIKSASVHYYYRQKEDLGVALVDRYAAGFNEALAEKSAKSQSPEDKIKAFCAVYRNALTTSGQACLCGILSSESAGLPKPVADAARRFIRENIAWIMNALPASLPDADRKRRATHIVAALQGAMALAASFGDQGLFDAVVDDINADGVAA
ncbi:MAG: TetR/AcrR family transcriptional regulator [Pseudomonadota bacterium]